MLTLAYRVLGSDSGHPRRERSLGHCARDEWRDAPVEDAGDDVVSGELSDGMTPASAWAAASSISLVIARARTSSAPRKTPGKTSTLLIWFG